MQFDAERIHTRNYPAVVQYLFPKSVLSCLGFSLIPFQWTTDAAWVSSEYEMLSFFARVKLG